MGIWTPQELRKRLSLIVDNNTQDFRYAFVVRQMEAKSRYVFHVIESKGIADNGGVSTLQSYCYFDESDLAVGDTFLLDFFAGYCRAKVYDSQNESNGDCTIMFTIKDRAMVRIA